MPNWQHQLGFFGGIPMTIFYCCQSDCAAQPLTMRKNKSRSTGSKYKCQVTDLSQEVNRQKGKFQKENIQSRGVIREPWRLWLHTHWQICLSLLRLGSCSPQVIPSLLPFPALAPLFVQLRGEHRQVPVKNDPPEMDQFPFWFTSEAHT